MNNILKLFKNLACKRIILFGTGSTAKALYEMLPLKIQYCVDNETHRWSKYFEDLMIKSPNALVEENKDEIAVVVASQYYLEISKQLNDMGFLEHIHYWDGYSLICTKNQIQLQLQNSNQQNILLQQCLFELKKQRELNEMRYRDLLQLLDFRPKHIAKDLINLSVTANVAVDSIDHLYPNGTANDNTRWPAFVIKCEKHFPGELSYLDLGCSGGGLVFDFAMRGHLAVGLEGSDYSLKRVRAEWRTIPDNLFTCDIAKPFIISLKDNPGAKQFQVITAWDVLEHLSYSEIEVLLDNIMIHLHDVGFFIGTVATRPDVEVEQGVNHHVTVKSKEWWLQLFEKIGFLDVSNKGYFETTDFPRGTGNFNSAVDLVRYPELGFHFVLKKQTMRKS